MISDLNKCVPENNKKVPVYLNVYDFWTCFNTVFTPIGLGVYHSGIQIFDDQYMFFGFQGNDSGIGYIQPFTASYHFSQQILLGYVDHQFYQFQQNILDPLRGQFIGNSYDLLGNNCNHFARRLAKQLKVEQKFPSKIFRITDCCNLLRCCIPQCILNGRLDWFDWSSPPQQYSQYEQLQQSVKQQDIKMISFKSKDQDIQEIQIHRKQKQLKLSKHAITNQHHKSTTLRKNIWPHQDHSHQKISQKRHSFVQDSIFNNSDQGNKKSGVYRNNK